VASQPHSQGPLSCVNHLEAHGLSSSIHCQTCPVPCRSELGRLPDEHSMQEALKTSNPATVNNFILFWYYNAQEQHILQVKSKFCLPIETERVHLAYLQKSKLCLFHNLKKRVAQTIELYQWSIVNIYYV
jgi:hypothetical protein